MGLHVCPPFITLYGYVICNGAVDVRGFMLSNYPVSGSYTFWWCGHTTLVLLNIVPPHITMLEPHCHGMVHRMGVSLNHYNVKSILSGCRYCGPYCDNSCMTWPSFMMTLYMYWTFAMFMKLHC